MLKNREYLLNEMLKKKSMLCVGIDPDLSRISSQFNSSGFPIVDFAKCIIEQTCEYAIAYKLNIAFFESLGPIGWEQLEQIKEFIPKECLFIADAKRADIGNTSSMYAKYFFERLDADAITLHPYMGLDSLSPFLEHKSKWSIILALTSNPGSADFEKLMLENGRLLYEEVLTHFSENISADQAMFVVGATHPDHFLRIRSIVPDHFLLVPGIGAQGGDLKATIQLGKNDHGGLLINVGRSIIYPESKSSFEKDVQHAAKYFQSQMQEYWGI